MSHSILEHTWHLGCSQNLCLNILEKLSWELKWAVLAARTWAAANNPVLEVSCFCWSQPVSQTSQTNTSTALTPHYYLMFTDRAKHWAKSKSTRSSLPSVPCHMLSPMHLCRTLYKVSTRGLTKNCNLVIVLEWHSIQNGQLPRLKGEAPFIYNPKAVVCERKRTVPDDTFQAIKKTALYNYKRKKKI